MPDPITGNKTLFSIEVDTDVWVVLARQRNAQVQGQSQRINASSKDDGADGTFLTGQRTSTLTLEGLFTIGDPALQKLKDAQAAQTEVNVRRVQDSVEIEQATCVVEDVSENHPDNEVATVSVTLPLKGGWSAI